MIHVICGLIGAGKTTYAKSHYQYVTDFDELLSKERQIAETLRLHNEGKTVAHITCFPTRLEQMAFYKLQPKMIWIATSLEKSMSNVEARGRDRDMIDLSRVMKSNMELLKSKTHSYYKWNEIDVFE